MQYSERPCPRLWALWILGLAVPVLLLLSGQPSVSEHEAKLAVRAAVLLDHGIWGNDAILGQESAGVWLQDWLTAGVAARFGFSEFGVRLPQTLLILLLAAICAWGSGKVAGIQAGAVSAAAAVSSGYSFLLIDRAGNELLACVLLSFAWLCWFRFSREKKRWNYAWLVAHTCVLFAIFAIGPLALVMFYVPLIFLRRPLKIRRRLGQADHFVSLLALIGFVLLWIFGHTSADTTLDAIGDTLEWRFGFWRSLAHLAAMPLVAAIGFLPWSFLVWPGFCHAFRRLEQEAVFGALLRTLILATAALGWLFPTRGMTLAPALGPLCMLVGLNYEMLVRRHGKQLLLIPRVLAVAQVPLIGAVLVASLVHEPPVVPRSGLEMLTSATAVIGSLLLAAAIHRRKVVGPIWLHVLIGVVALKLAWCGSMQIYRGHTGSEARAQGLVWRSHVPEGEPVHWLLKPGRFPVETYYLRRECRFVGAERVLPRTSNKVFALAREQPVTPGRNWQVAVAGDDHRPTLWQGQLELFKIRPPMPLVGRDAGGTMQVATQFELVNQQQHTLHITALEPEGAAVFATGVLPATIEPGKAVLFTLRMNKERTESQPGRHAVRVMLSVDGEEMQRLIHVQLHSTNVE